ncbi:hypothetical protein GWI33_015004, partial [Rhynchophorus ferrugineus]
MVKQKKYKVVTVVKKGEDAVIGDQTYRYLTADEMKSLGDDSLPIDVTRDERIDSNKMTTSMDSNMLPPQHIEDSISPEHVTRNYVEYIKKYTPDNVDINRHPINIGKLHWKNFLVSFLVDARGGAMRGCRHSGVRVIVPPRCAASPTRITCRYVRPQRTPHPPPLMEGEALASRVLELGPVGAKFLGPVIIEVPHFAALRGKEREIVILRSDNGESWKEHTVDATEEVLNEVLHDSFEAEDLNQMEDISSGRITRIVTQDFPQYFAVVSRIRQEVHAIGPEGGMVSSTVVPQVQAIFPEGALTKKIKVGLQAQPIDPELTAKLLGHGVAVSPVVTVEPRRRKFHKAIRLNMPVPTAHSQGMINQYSGSAPTLRLLCSITGGTTRAQWEDVTGSTPLTFVNDVVSFTTTVSARFWLIDCRNIGDATKMATELYKEAIHVPFMAKFVVFAKRVDPLEARLRVFCMTDDKEDKTLEHQEHFTEVAKSRDVEVLEGKSQYIEFAGNLVPITKSGEQLQFSFRAFRENRLPFSVRVKDQHAEAVGRCLFMREAKVPKGEPPQQPICILNIVLPDDIVTDTISLTDIETGKRHMYLSDFQDYYRPDPRLADMSNLLGEDWVELAHQLGLTSSEINVIKSEYPESIAKQAQSMLRMWLSQSSNKAQTNTLENALKRIGREDIIPQCLNVEHTHTITRIKEEEIGYRLKKKGDIDEADKKKMIEHYDKYSAEEKVVEKSESEEEDNFDKSVTERRVQIEKRLSAERVIPASSQRREIVQEISTIKRQSIVEDKIAEANQKVETDVKDLSVKPDVLTTVSETTVLKTTPTSETVDSGIVSMEQPDVITKKLVETHTIIEETVKHIPGEEPQLMKGITSKLEETSEQILSREDVKSPKLSKTPPPSPADFLLQKGGTSIQVSSASPQDDDDSLDTDGFREGQCLLETPTPGEASPRTQSDFPDVFDSPREDLGDIDIQEVTPYEDVARYYQHQARYFVGPRKRLASTEDLDNADVIDSFDATSDLLPSTRHRNLTGIAKVGLVNVKAGEKEPTRPGELCLRSFSSSPEEKGAKDSKKPEDWERKERKTVERLHGGAGKTGVPTEEKVALKTTPEKVRLAYKGETTSITTKSSDKEASYSTIRISTDVNEREVTGLPVDDISYRGHVRHVHKGTSPPSKKDLDPSPDISPASSSDKPSLELIIGRKEVRTKDASATAESRLTLYGRKDVEISIKSQSHISVTTFRRDNTGTETSQKFDVGITSSADTEKFKYFEDTELEGEKQYIIPTGERVIDTKKREETVNFSGTKHIYTYDNANNISDFATSISDDSASHPITDTGISLTRGTTTETLSLGKQALGALGVQTTGFISDTNEIEEGECTDAGLSPIQADETIHQETDDLIHLMETATSPIDFPVSQVDTSEAATITDQIDTKDASNSPIKVEESPPLSTADMLKDEEILTRRRGSGDVKAKIRMIEEQTGRHTFKTELKRKRRDIVDSEDELSSMKEEEVLRASTETLAQVDDDEYKMESISEQIVKEQVEDFSEKSSSISKTATSTPTKHIGRKIAELQKIFSAEGLDEQMQVKVLPKDRPTSADIPKIPSSIAESSFKQETYLEDTLFQKVQYIDDEPEEIYKSVKDKRNMFEELISKSQEGTPVKKIAYKYKKEPFTEKQYTEEELKTCLASIEKDIIDQQKLQDELKQSRQDIIIQDSLDKTEPCVEPPCIKLHVKPKYPVQVIEEETISSGELKEPLPEKLEGDEEGETGGTPQVVKKAIVAHAKLISTIALPSEIIESEKISTSLERDTHIEKIDEKEAVKRISPQTLEWDKRETNIPITQTDVQKLMFEVLQASKQIREDVKELKPDLTPTPEGLLVQVIPSTLPEKDSDGEYKKEDISTEQKRVTTKGKITSDIQERTEETSVSKTLESKKYLTDGKAYEYEELKDMATKSSKIVEIELVRSIAATDEKIVTEIPEQVSIVFTVGKKSEIVPKTPEADEIKKSPISEKDESPVTERLEPVVKVLVVEKPSQLVSKSPEVVEVGKSPIYEKAELPLSEKLKPVVKVAIVEKPSELIRTTPEVVEVAKPPISEKAELFVSEKPEPVVKLPIVEKPSEIIP